MRLVLTAGQREQIAREAMAALPQECCGLIEGVTSSDKIVVIALHPTGNLSSDPDRFEIDPAEQFRLMRALRGTGRAIVGCYHSHPGGKPEPSIRDRSGAGEEGFVWLVAAPEKEPAEIGAYLFRNGAFHPISVSAPG